MDSQILQYIFSGLTIGSVYALVALGFNLIYNSTYVINFAQGEFVMMGGMLSIYFLSLGLPVFFACCISVIIVGLCSIAMLKLAIEPSRGASLLILILITLGASSIFKGLILIIMGREYLSFAPFSGERSLNLLGASIPTQALWIIGIMMAVSFTLLFFFNKTIWGKALRGCAINEKAAKAVGINLKRMVSLSFFLSGVIGSIAGVAVTPMINMNFARGTFIGIKGFAAFILGGAGSSIGSVIGGLSLGLLEALGAGFISSGLKDIVGFVVLICVLLIRPTGIAGKAEVARD